MLSNFSPMLKPDNVNEASTVPGALALYLFNLASSVRAKKTKSGPIVGIRPESDPLLSAFLEHAISSTQAEKTREQRLKILWFRFLFFILNDSVKPINEIYFFMDWDHPGNKKSRHRRLSKIIG